MHPLRNLAVCGLVACVALVAAGPALAAEGDWKVGLASVKITPDQPVMMAGYQSRTRPFDKVEHDLYAKALALEDSEGHKAVLVTSDLIGFRASFAEPICERIMQRTGLKREQILLSSSHTHTGPAVGLGEQPRGNNQPEGEFQRTVDYTRGLQDKVVDVVLRSLEKMEPAQLSYGFGVVHFVMNRREFTPKGVILGANPRGLADRSVPVMQITGADGKPRAILFGAAVHNTTLRPNAYDISGDYAGFAQSNLQEKFPGAQAMFMLGCAGDADPYPHGTIELAREHGKELSDEVIRVLGTKLTPIRGPLKIAFGKADLPLQPQPSREELEKIAADRQNARQASAQQMIAALDRGEKLPTAHTCPLTVWQFGPDLTMVGLSGEVVVDYLKFIENALGPNQLWVAAYCNDVYGYLPSARVLAEGGYEARGIRSGVFSADAEKALVQKVRELAVQAGRKGVQ